MRSFDSFDVWNNDGIPVNKCQSSASEVQRPEQKNVVDRYSLGRVDNAGLLCVASTNHCDVDTLGVPSAPEIPHRRMDIGRGVLVVAAEGLYRRAMAHAHQRSLTDPWVIG